MPDTLEQPIPFDELLSGLAIRLINLGAEEMQAFESSLGAAGAQCQTDVGRGATAVAPDGIEANRIESSGNSGNW